MRHNGASSRERRDRFSVMNPVVKVNRNFFQEDMSMKRSSFQKVGILIASFCVSFVITASGLTATREKTVGEWDIKIKFNGREITSNLKITQQEDGSYTGKWESRRGESTVTDVIFKDGKLSFKRKSKYGDQEWESTFTGTVEGNKLTGKIKGEWGEIEANGKRLMPSVFGKWEFTTETQRGTQKRVLTLKEDMTGTYQMRDREVPIKELKIEEQEIAFKLEMRFGERSSTMDFRGKVEGDTINGEFITQRGKREVKGKRAGTETAGITAEEAIDQLDKMIETAKQTGKVENIDEAVAAIEAAAENMKTADLLEKLEVLQEHREDSSLPKPEKALSSNQKLDWAILTRQIRGQKDLPVDKVKAHPAAKAFPGTVDIKAKRIKKAVEIWTDRPGWRNKGIYAESWKKEWQSTGLYAAPGEVITITVTRKRAERFVTDTQISAGYMHSGYPLMAGLDIGSTFVDKARIMRNGHGGVWGLFHEIGHNHQNSLWVYRGTTEVTVNLFSLYVFEKMCGLEPKDKIHGGVLPANREHSLKKYLEDGKKFEKWQRDPFLALYMYSMMQEDFGWEPFTKVFKEYRAADKSELPKNDDDKRDQWMVRFSRMVGKNLGPFFDAWGVPTSQEAKKSISSLSTWMPADFPEVKASKISVE